MNNRHCLAGWALLVSVLVVSAAGANPAADTIVYLPVIMKPPPLARAVAQQIGEIIGYPTTYYAFGYLENLTDTPLDASVAVDVTIYSIEPRTTATTLELAELAFPVTLPGQPNPFRYSLLLSKASAVIHGVSVASASPHDQQTRYAVLTVVNSTVEGLTFTGMVRNESAESLQAARLVAYNALCSWREASLQDTVLAPGQETSFSIIYASAGCFTEPMITVGQGLVFP